MLVQKKTRFPESYSENKDMWNWFAKHISFTFQSPSLQKKLFMDTKVIQLVQIERMFLSIFWALSNFKIVNNFTMERNPIQYLKNFDATLTTILWKRVRLFKLLTSNWNGEIWSKIRSFQYKTVAICFWVMCWTRHLTQLFY